MFIDDMCADLLREGPLDRMGYPAAIFSNKTRDEFLAYLAKLE
jgi:hypothetical protein